MPEKPSPSQLAMESVSEVPSDTHDIRRRQMDLVKRMLTIMDRGSLTIPDFCDYLNGWFEKSPILDIPQILTLESDPEGNLNGYANVLNFMYKQLGDIFTTKGIHASIYSGDDLKLLINSSLASMVQIPMNEQEILTDLDVLTQFQHDLNCYLNLEDLTTLSQIESYKNEETGNIEVSALPNDPVQRAILYEFDVIAGFLNSRFYDGPQIENRDLGLLIAVKELIDKDPTVTEIIEIDGQETRVVDFSILTEKLKDGFYVGNEQGLREKITAMLVLFEDKQESYSDRTYFEKMWRATLPNYESSQLPFSVKEVEQDSKRLKLFLLVQKAGNIEKLIADTRFSNKLAPEIIQSILEMYLATSGHVFKYTIPEIVNTFKIGKATIDNLTRECAMTSLRTN